MRKFTIWILTVIITICSAVFQRITGPTYPKSGNVSVSGNVLNYKFLRSCETTKDCEVKISIPNSNYKGMLCWKRYKTSDNFTCVNMTNENSSLIAYIPKQPAAGKIEYYVIAGTSEIKCKIPEDNIVLRYKGEVPILLIIVHVLFMFVAMLTATRAGLDFIDSSGNSTKSYALMTIIFTLVGGFILGPFVQKYAFGAYWTGIPFGYDLTDNKTLLAMLVWLVSYWGIIKGKKPKLWATIAAITMLLIYMIPHSLFGSELDYNKYDKNKTNISKIRQ